MHRPTISEIEAGNRKVSADELQHFAQMYDVSIDWLLGRKADGPASRASRFERVCRALRKLDPGDIDRLMDLIAILRGRDVCAGRGSRSAESPLIEWTPSDNARRCELIDRKIEGSLTFDEAEELEELQQAMRRYLDRAAPLPMKGAKRLHAALVRKHRSRPQ